MSTHSQKLTSLVGRSIAGSGLCIAAAIKAMEDRIGPVDFKPREDDPRYTWFAQTYPTLKNDLALFSHGVGKEVDADAGLGKNGLDVVNALLERAKANKRLEYTGDEDSAYIGAFCAFTGGFIGGSEIVKAPAFSQHHVIGAAIPLADNKIEFYEKDGAQVAIITDSKGDSVMLYSVDMALSIEHEFSQSFYGYTTLEAVRSNWKRIERAGVAFPSAAFDIEPDVSYFVDGKFSVGGKPGTWVQALSQARFRIDQNDYRAEVVFAAAAVLESMSHEPDIADYMVISPAYAMGVVLHRPGAKFAHFGAVVTPDNFKGKKAA